MVLVEDECRVKRESGLKSIWYPQGQYPDIKVDQNKEAMGFYGALNVETGKEHVMPAPRQVSQYTVQFLRRLEKIYRGQKVLIIWDGAPWHRGKVRSYLKEEDKRWQLELMCFPAYSPDLNPQEGVWKQARQETTHNSELSFEDKTYNFYKYLISHRFKTNFLNKYDSSK